MSSECDIRDNMLGGTSPDLNALTDHALRLIQTHIFQNAHRVNQSQAVTLSLSFPPREHTISPSELIFEIEKNDLDKKLLIDTSRTRGCYIKEDGKIYLNSGNWCIKTIIHETLHACSRTSESNELDRFMPLFEGLTELYTGFILLTQYPLCYQNCYRTNIERLCQITYEEFTRLWVAFCNFVPLTITTGLYFNDNNTWNVAVDNFINEIRQEGFQNFGNPFGRGNLPIHFRFAIQCRRAFGEEFDAICENRNRYTNFSNV